jgi:hypothetical protein
LYDVDTTYLSGRWWRHIPAGGDVFYEPADPADNRWQRGHVVDAWYFADEEPTVWAEWYRAASELGVPPVAMLPRDLWQWEISLTRIADLSDPQRLARLNLPVPKPGRAPGGRRSQVQVLSPRSHETPAKAGLSLWRKVRRGEQTGTIRRAC